MRLQPKPLQPDPEVDASVQLQARCLPLEAPHEARLVALQLGSSEYHRQSGQHFIV